MSKKFFFFLSIILFCGITIANSNDDYSTALQRMNNKEYSAAYSLFKIVAEDNNADEQKKIMAKYYMGECLTLLGQLDGAASHFEEFIEEFLFSNYRDQALHSLGMIYYKRAEYRKAREKLLYLLETYPRSEYAGTVYYWIAETYAAENRFYEAEENFKKAIAAHPNNKFIVNSIYSLAQLYENMGKYSEAVANYDELLAYYKNNPLAPLAQLRIGVCYFNLKEYDSAVLELTDPLIKELSEKELLEAKYFLASAFVRLKDHQNALEIFNELLKVNLQQEFINKIKYSIAWVNFQNNDYQAAYEIFNFLSKNENDTLSISSLFWSAECKRYMGDNETSNQIYNQFVEKYPQHSLATRAKLGKGTVFFTSNQSSQAESILIDATISGDNLTKGRAFTLLGEINLNKKDYNQARNNFTSAVQFSANDLQLNSRALLGLGVTEFYLNNFNNAVNNLQQVKSKSSGFEPDKVNFYLAESYMARGEYAAALRHYNQVSNTDNTIRKETLYGKAYAYFNLKDFPNAVYYFNEYTTRYRNDQNINDAKLRLADSYFGIKNFERASVIYKELFTRDRSTLSNDQAYYQYCQSLFKAGKASEAIQEFSNLQRSFPRSKYADASQYVVGWIHFQQNDFRAAINSYNNLLTRYRQSQLIPIVYYSIGDSYFNLAQYDSSIFYYNKILKEYPNTSYILDAVNGIQYAYVAIDQVDNAVIFIDQFILSNPTSSYSDQIFFKKGDIYYSSDNYPKAIESYREFVQRYPSSSLIPNAYYWIGKSASNLKRESEAIENFNKAIERSKRSEIGISSVIELATIYSNQKQYALAVQVLNSIIDAMPTSNRLPELLFLRASAEVKDNKLANAFSTYEQIINYYDGSVFAAKSKVELGILEIERKNYENAMNLLKEAAENRLDDIGAQAQYYYGVALFNQEKINDAITAFVRVRSIFAAYDEWYTKSLLKLGDCYVKINDKKQARDMYRAVIARHRTGEYAQEANRKINRL